MKGIFFFTLMMFWALPAQTQDNPEMPNKEEIISDIESVDNLSQEDKQRLKRSIEKTPVIQTENMQQVTAEEKEKALEAMQQGEADSEEVVESLKEMQETIETQQAIEQQETTQPVPTPVVVPQPPKLHPNWDKLPESQKRALQSWQEKQKEQKEMLRRYEEQVKQKSLPEGYLETQ